MPDKEWNFWSRKLESGSVVVEDMPSPPQRSRNLKGAQKQKRWQSGKISIEEYTGTWQGYGSERHKQKEKMLRGLAEKKKIERAKTD